MKVNKIVAAVKKVAGLAWKAVRHEPVVTAAVAGLVVAVVSAFGLDLSADTVVSVLVVLGFAAVPAVRAQVTPTVKSGK